MRLPFQQPFDARQVTPSEAQQAVPAGEYKVVVIESDVVPTSKGDSGMLVLKLQIVEGQFAQRTMKYFLNLWNSNPQTCEIAQHQLSALCHVTGVFNLQDSQQLHGIPFVGVVTINANGYNDVKGVKHLDGSQPGKSNAAPMASAVPQAQPPQGWGPPAPQQQPVYTQPPAQPAYAPPAAPAAPAWNGQPAAPAPPAPAWSPAPAQPAPPAAPQWGTGAAAPAPPWSNK